VRPIGLGDRAFDSYVVYFSVVVSALSFSVEVNVGSFGDYEDCAVGGEGIRLLQRLLNLWQRWGWWIGFSFDLSIVVVWHWVCDLLYC
jgi:hypothetical protein